MARFFRFRIVHLGALVAVVAAVMWLVTQAGMSHCEIEILELSGTPAIYRNGTNVDPLHDFSKLKFRVLCPSDQQNVAVNVFLRSNLPPGFRNQPIAKSSTEVPIKEGARLLFRYRQRPVFWLQRDNITELVLHELGIKRDNIEEIISEHFDPALAH